MAGLIRVNQEQQWSVAGWVFDHVLRVTRSHLPQAGSSRIVELIANAETGINYLSLESLSADEVKIFRKALENAYQELRTSGGASFGEPEFYPQFMQRFEELLEIVPTG